MSGLSDLKRSSGKIKGPVLAGALLAMIFLLIIAGFGIYLLFRQNVQVIDLHVSAAQPVYGSDLSAIAEVENKGILKTNYTARILIDGQDFISKEVVLEPNSPTALSIDISDLSAGSHVLILDNKEIEFTVYRPAQFVLTDLTVHPDLLLIGDTAAVNLTITNTGDLAGDFSAELLYDKIAVEVLFHVIDPGDTITLETLLQLDLRGPHSISVNDLSRDINVLAPATIVLDRVDLSAEFAAPGESVQISSRYVNTGDIAGEHLVELIINGETAQSEVILLEPDETAAVEFEINEESAGYYEIQIDDITRTLQVVTITRPDNGSLIIEDANRGYGRLTLVNEYPDSDALFVLTSAADRETPVLTAYLRADSTADNIRVRDDTYYVYYTVGNDYDSSSGHFTASPEYGLFEDPIQFETTYEGSTTYYSIWTISINVNDGNVSAAAIDENDFPD